jgi:hypothetical protein
MLDTGWGKLRSVAREACRIVKVLRLKVVHALQPCKDLLGFLHVANRGTMLGVLLHAIYDGQQCNGKLAAVSLHQGLVWRQQGMLVDYRPLQFLGHHAVEAALSGHTLARVGHPSAETHEMCPRPFL